MAREMLGEMPELVEQLARTGLLEVKLLRWTDVQVFNLIEMLTSRSFVCDVLCWW